MGPRTQAEADVFYEALPSMGNLYTVYPVVVLPEVTEGVHGYFGSGWCCSEFYSAMLAKQLTQFSPHAIDDWIETIGNLRGVGHVINPTTLYELNEGRLKTDSIENFKLLLD